MNIKCTPSDPNHPAHKKVHTNIGEFWPNEVKGVAANQEDEARRLIANGEFEETDEEPNGNELQEEVLASAQSDPDTTAGQDAGATRNSEPVPQVDEHVGLGTRARNAIARVTGRSSGATDEGADSTTPRNADEGTERDTDRSRTSGTDTKNRKR